MLTQPPRPPARSMALSLEIARSLGLAITPTRRDASGLFVTERDYGKMHGRDRNKPCPCGSLRKLKKCHGR